jgi:putative ABC transport system permease protein
VTFPKIYVPFRQHLAVYPAWVVGGLHLTKDVVIRTSSDPDDLLATMREAVAQVDGNQLPDAVMTVDDALAGVGDDARFWMRFLMICGGVAIVLAALGLYAVIAQSVAQRTHELGVRMALGAQKADLRRQVLRQGLVLVLLGVAVGLAAALGLARIADSLLVGVSPLDPVAFGAAALVMVGVALLASYLPARRATEVDAVVALRQQ